jgi:hypothetical protein
MYDGAGYDRNEPAKASHALHCAQIRGECRGIQHYVAQTLSTRWKDHQMIWKKGRDVEMKPTKAILVDSELVPTTLVY